MAHVLITLSLRKSTSCLGRRASRRLGVPISDSFLLGRLHVGHHHLFSLLDEESLRAEVHHNSRCGEVLFP